MPSTYTCPACGQVSLHPMDVKFGWCSRCEAFSGLDDERLASLVDGQKLAKVSLNRHWQAVQELTQRRLRRQG